MLRSEMSVLAKIGEFISDVGKSLNHHESKVLGFDHDYPWEGRYHWAKF